MKTHELGAGATLTVALRKSFAAFDFIVPALLHEHDACREHPPRRLSAVQALHMRASESLSVHKCIYPRLPYVPGKDPVEKSFIEWAQVDGSVQAFCKIRGVRDDFLRLRYEGRDGGGDEISLLCMHPSSEYVADYSYYSPDFLLRTACAVFLVHIESRQPQPELARKLQAANAWCARINALDETQRGRLPWRCVALNEALVRDWWSRGIYLADLLEDAREHSAEEMPWQLCLDV